LRKFLKHITPQFLQEWYRQKKRQKRHEQLKQDKANGNSFDKNALLLQLQQAGIRQSDVLMVHSSLSKMGFVEGGASTLIKTLQEAIGITGTLVMPSFPAIGFNHDYLKQTSVFDVEQTPSKMGSVTETFRLLPHVKRSWHPTDAVCALGPQANFLTNTHHLQTTPYHIESPFYKLCELNAKILLIGVDFNSLTNLHTLEDAISDFKFPVYKSQKIVTKIKHEGGELNYLAACHDPIWSKKRQCNALILPFKSAGFLKEKKLGKAIMYVIEAKVMHQFMVKQYLEKGITMYTPNGEVTA
jgi:aminoglycoside 3-N-acetyltransferase